jgi:hypothetical protein
VLCAAEEVVALGGAPRAKRVRSLLSRLSRADPAPPPEPPPTPPQASGPPPPAGAAQAAGGGGGGAPDSGGGGSGGVASGGAASGGGVTMASVLAGQLEEEVGAEDPWNGELAVRLLDMPFIDPAADAAEAAAWQV